MKCGWNLPDFTGEILGHSPHPAFIKLKSFCWNTFIILGGFHRWNLGEIHQISWLKSTRFQGEIHQISRVKSPTLHSSNWRVFAKTLAFIILGGFHRSNLGEICQISWMKSTRFQGEILAHSPHPAFIKLKSFCWNNCFYNFGWISQVKSGWNLPDFMGEIHHFSWWNLVDFMKSLVIAPTLHSSNWRVFAETLAFIILGGFHR